MVYRVFYRLAITAIIFWISSFLCTFVVCNVELEQQNQEYVLSRPQWQALEQLAERLSHDDLEQYSTASEQKRAAAAAATGAGMWFGPRLGKRSKRQSGNSGAVIEAGGVESREQHAEELASMLELLQDQPWAVVALTGGRRYTMNYTPRLGRQSGEQLGGAEGPGEQRIPPFAPRLGRKLNTPFSPRLGRELFLESLGGNFAQQPRYVRSVKKSQDRKTS